MMAIWFGRVRRTLDLALISSKTSGFLFWGIILDPVIYSSGKSMNLNSEVMYRQISIENRERVCATEARAEPIAISILPLLRLA